MIHYHIFIHKNITFNEDIVDIFTQNVGNIKIISLETVTISSSEADKSSYHQWRQYYFHYIQKIGTLSYQNKTVLLCNADYFGG